MLKNYLKIAFRNLKRHKGFSLINILGLAIGMACCILLLQYVLFEFSYDNFHKNADNIYRLQYDSYKNNSLRFHLDSLVPPRWQQWSSIIYPTAIAKRLTKNPILRLENKISKKI